MGEPDLREKAFLIAFKELLRASAAQDFLIASASGVPAEAINLAEQTVVDIARRLANRAYPPESP